jgi:hypothetical protein
MDEAKRIRLSLLAFVLAVYVALTVVYAALGYLDRPGERIRGVDTVYYYIYLRSMVFDQDIDFRNELEHYWGPGGMFTPVTGTGLPGSVWSVGPAIFWSPFYLAAHATAPEGEDDGYSSAYGLSVYVANSLYALVGLWATSLLLLRFVSPRAAALGVLAVMLSTQMTYYIWPLYPESHSVSFASTAVFLYLYVSRGISLGTALAAGCMVLSRWQDAIYLLPVLMDTVADVRERLRLGGGLDRKWVGKRLLFAATVALVFLPQVLAWQALYGRLFLVPQGEGFLSLRLAPLIQILFSTNHGLLSWHPAIALGLVGLVFLRGRQPRLALALGLAFVLQWAVNASVLDWWAHWSFGHRRFVSYLPVVALGVGAIAERFPRRATALAVVIVLLGVWNQLFLFQYQRGLVPRSGELTFAEFVTDKFRLPRIVKGESAATRARQALGEGDVEGFGREAEEAYRLAPSLHDVIVARALSAMIDGDARMGEEAFGAWISREPDEELARVGLIAMRLSLPARERGLKLASGGELDRRYLGSLVEEVLRGRKREMGEGVWAGPETLP